MEIDWKKVSDSLRETAETYHKQATAGVMARDAAHVMLGSAGVVVALANAIDAGTSTGETKA